MEATATNTQIGLFESAIVTFKNGGLILSTNVNRAANAVIIGEAIIAEIEAAGGKLNKELDNKCQQYLAKIAVASTEMNASRKPITQAMDLVKSNFTEAENSLDNKKQGTKAYIIQQHRNQYAKERAEEDRLREQEELKKAAKAQEAISIAGEAERRIQWAFNDALVDADAKLSTRFYGIKLLVFDAQALLFADECPEFTADDYDTVCNRVLAENIAAVHHSAADVKSIVVNTISGRFEEFAAQFAKYITANHQQWIAGLPERKKALEALSTADADEKKRLLEEQEAKRKEDEDRLQKESETRLQEGEAAITAQAEEQTMDVLFAQETAIAAVHTPKPESRQAVGITVTDAQGWPLIFQTWFTHEGSLLGIDAAAKVSLGSMVKFCEARAKKYGERIESPFIAYSNTVRAVNRK